MLQMKLASCECVSAFIFCPRDLSGADNQNKRYIRIGEAAIEYPCFLGCCLSSSGMASITPPGSTEPNQFRYPRSPRYRETRIRRSSFPPPQHSAHAA
jgi:hypothetical protein